MSDKTPQRRFEMQNEWWLWLLIIGGVIAAFVVLNHREAEEEAVPLNAIFPASETAAIEPSPGPASVAMAEVPAVQSEPEPPPAPEPAPEPQDDVPETVVKPVFETVKPPEPVKEI